MRSQFCHAIDLAPTILDAAGIDPPAVVDGVDQQPMHGASLLPTFADAGADAPRDSQYFEMLGSRSMVRGRWKATTDHISQGVPDEVSIAGSRDFNTDRWALFDLDADFSEARDLSDEHPEVVAELEALWWSDAGRFNVLPLDDTLTGRVVAMEPSPHPLRYRWRYRPHGRPVAEEALPPLAGGYRMRVVVDPIASGASGVLCATGDWTNGWALVMLDGHLTYLLSRFGVPYRVQSEAPVPEGTTELGIEYSRQDPGGGEIRLTASTHESGSRSVVDLATGRIPRDLSFRWQIGGARFLVGRDQGFPVSDDYAVPFPFSGLIHHLEFEIPAFEIFDVPKPAGSADVHAALATD